MSVGHLYTMSLRATKSSSLELTSGPQPACDRCRRRKQRCDSQQTCSGCRKAGAACTYDLPRKRKGAKRRKDRVPCSSVGSKEDLERQDVSSQRRDVQQQMIQNLLSSETSETTSQFSAVKDNSLVRTTTYEASFDDLDVSDNLDCFASRSAAGLDIVSLNEQLNLSPLLAGGRTANDIEIHFPPNPTIVGSGCQSTFLLPRQAFQPYLHLFFSRLYPIFPVVDRKDFLDNFMAVENQRTPLQPGEYAFLTALSAAVLLQLNVAEISNIAGPASHSRASDFLGTETGIETLSAGFLVSQCIQTRQQWPFMETADDLNILTSFFLFAYYGNMDQPRSAWYYLREAISFALSLRLGEESSYTGLDEQTAQRYRRLYWLLFITERAYSLQHRNDAILRRSIGMPRVFGSEDPQLVYGFVVLVNIFKTIDEEFVTTWKALPSSCVTSHLDIQKSNDENTTQPADALGHPGPLQSQELDETQRIDIMVTQHWLCTLIWQMHVKQTGANLQTFRVRSTTRYPFDVSHDLLGLISAADRQSLECHGIGMEQKIFDVACCLSDVLKFTKKLTAEEFSSGHNMLYGFMTLLAGFRNQESRYLQPLVRKAANILVEKMSVPATLSKPVQPEQEPGDLRS